MFLINTIVIRVYAIEKWLLFLRPPPSSRDDTFQRCSGSDRYRDCYWVFFDVRTLRLFFHITAHQAKRPVVGPRAILYACMYILICVPTVRFARYPHTHIRVYVCVWIINITPTPFGPSRDRRPNTPQTSTSTERTAAYSRVNIADLPSAQRRAVATRSVETPLTREEFF